MALRTMREVGDAILHKRSKELKRISKRDLYLIEDMLDTMYDREGVGLAAPQVGVLKRIVVIHGGINEIKASDEHQDNERLEGSEEVEEGRETKESEGVKEISQEEIEEIEETIELPDVDPIILVNPVIIKEEGSQTGEEACLSVPGKWGMVTRPEKVTVRAVDVNMEEFELEGEGVFARAICHEIDHLDGKLYVDLVEGELRDADDRNEEENEGK